MNINNIKKRGFSRLSILSIFLVLVIVLLSVSCSGSENNNKTAVKEIEKSVDEIKDSSVVSSGNIVQTTCLECHPEVKDGEFSIDFNKVKTSSVAHSEKADVKKKSTEESEK